MEINPLTYLEVMRPVNGIMAAVAVYLGGLVAGAGGLPLLMAAVSAFLIMGGGMVANDYFDVEIDRINNPDRPLPSGRMSMRTAAVYSVLLFVTGLALAVPLGPMVLGLAIFNSGVEILYAWKGKRTFLLGHLMVAWLTGTTYVYGALLGTALTGPLIFGFIAFFANLAREIYKAVTDVEGDMRHGIDTVAVAWGEERSTAAANVLAVVAAMTSLLPYILDIMGFIYLGIQMAAVMVYISALYVEPYEAEIHTKYGMVLGLLAIALDLAVGLYL